MRGHSYFGPIRLNPVKSIYQRYRFPINTSFFNTTDSLLIAYAVYSLGLSKHKTLFEALMSREADFDIFDEVFCHLDTGDLWGLVGDPKRDDDVVAGAFTPFLESVFGEPVPYETKHLPIGDDMVGFSGRREAGTIWLVKPFAGSGAQIAQYHITFPAQELPLQPRNILVPAIRALGLDVKGLKPFRFRDDIYIYHLTDTTFLIFSAVTYPWYPARAFMEYCFYLLTDGKYRSAQDNVMKVIPKEILDRELIHKVMRET